MEEKVKTENKLSYDDLLNVANQLQQQNMQLRKALQEVNYSNTFKRLDYLFKVMEFPEMFSDTFVENCTKEIEDTMTIPENNEEKEEE